MSYTLRFTSQFRKDVRLCQRRGYDMALLQQVMDLLRTGDPMPPQYQDHPLSGNWAGFRECHVASDWLLIYTIIRTTLVLSLTRTGIHSDLLQL